MALNNRKTALSPDEIEAAAALLLELVPVFLRFLDDEYDDTSMLVHPLLNDILNTVRVKDMDSYIHYLTITTV
jgi:hypothetical protein